MKWVFIEQLGLKGPVLRFFILIRDWAIHFCGKPLNV